MSKVFQEFSPELQSWFVESGSLDKAQALAAQEKIAKAIAEPLRDAVLSGNIANLIFTPDKWADNAYIEYQLSLIGPGQEGDFTAFVNPQNGYIPHKFVSADRIAVPTFSIANSIDCTLKAARAANYNFVKRMLQVMVAGFVKKNNDDAFHTLISAALDRNILVFDGDANAGQFTRRLYSLLKINMKRNGGGNSASMNKSKLTDILVSPETIEDMRNWSLAEVSDDIRTRFFLSEGSDGVTRIGDTLLHEVEELGAGQEYQLYFEAQGGTMGGSDTEIIIGLDLSTDDSFFNPVKGDMTVYPDEHRHRHQQISYYGWMEHGWAILDNRRVILASY